jgi:hypothetical protein
MSLSTSAIEKKVIVNFVIEYPILFVKIVIDTTITKKFGYAQIIGNNMK